MRGKRGTAADVQSVLSQSRPCSPTSSLCTGNRSLVTASLLVPRTANSRHRSQTKQHGRFLKAPGCLRVLLSTCRMPGGREGLAGPSQQPARPAPLIPSSAVEEQSEEGIWAERFPRQSLHRSLSRWATWTLMQPLAESMAIREAVGGSSEESKVPLSQKPCGQRAPLLGCTADWAPGSPHL